MYLALTSLSCMISKSFEKYINSLKQKKYREQYQRFIAEGDKTVKEFLQQHQPFEKIIALPQWIANNKVLINSVKEKLIEVTEIQMAKLSGFETPSPVLMVAEIIKPEINSKEVHSNLNLVLDGIRDPGNLGTIIRIADWFGIKNIFCSPDCVETYNPKTIQSSMGSVCRVNIFETELPLLFSEFKNITVVGTFMEGKNIFETVIPIPSFLIIGNESKGISSELEKFIKLKVTIPQTGNAESLNAAVATGILCAAIKNTKG
ncbi:MAG: RNA methyltransferase [Chitinophagales bacterium]|nr:RNA methyltransferase [Chitinophagales bacterium]